MEMLATYIRHCTLYNEIEYAQDEQTPQSSPEMSDEQRKHSARSK